MSKHPDQSDGIETVVRAHDALVSPEDYARLPRHPLTLVLDNLRSAFNVGSIFRTADTARLERIILCGYTPRPPNPKLLKTSMGTLDFVRWNHCATADQAVLELRQQGIQVFALETTQKSKSCFEAAIPKPAAFVLGNEALGVSPQALRQVDGILEIPLYGFKNSLNVASACAISVFEAIRQWGLMIGSATVFREPPS